MHILIPVVVIGFGLLLYWRFRKKAPALPTAPVLLAAPIPQSVAITVAGNSETDRLLVVHCLEKRLINDGREIVALPKDWKAWRNGGAYRRTILPKDPALIVEVSLSSIEVEVEDKRNNHWCVGVRIFYPDGRQRNSDHYRGLDFGPIATRIAEQLNGEDFNRGLEILGRETTSPTREDIK